MVASAEPLSFGAPASPRSSSGFLLVTTCVGRAGFSIGEGLVRSDHGVEDAESASASRGTLCEPIGARTDGQATQLPN